MATGIYSSDQPSFDDGLDANDYSFEDDDSVNNDDGERGGGLRKENKNCERLFFEHALDILDDAKKNSPGKKLRTQFDELVAEAKDGKVKNWKKITFGKGVAPQGYKPGYVNFVKIVFELLKQVYLDTDEGTMGRIKKALENARKVAKYRQIKLKEYQGQTDNQKSWEKWKRHALVLLVWKDGIDKLGAPIIKKLTKENNNFKEENEVLKEESDKYKGANTKLQKDYDILFEKYQRLTVKNE